MIDEQDPALLQEGVAGDAETVTDPQVAEEAAESPDDESGEGAGKPHEDQEGEAEGKPGDESDELEISIKGEEPPPATSKADAAFARMRRENAELKRKLQGQAQPETAVDPGEKPTFESCGYDAAAFEEKLDAWKEAKRKHEERASAAAKQATETARFWQTRKEVYAKGKEQLSKQVPAYEAAEEAVKAAIDEPRQNLLLSVADNPALVVAALGQRPKLLEEFAKETDPFRFAAKLAKLEANLSTTQKQKSKVPLPEEKVRGSGSPSGSTLERARADASESRDFTKVLEAHRARREKGSK